MLKKIKSVLQKEKRVFPIRQKKMGFNFCNIAYPLLIGTLLFALLYSGRRAHNRHRRRNRTGNGDTGNDIGISKNGVGTNEVGTGIPEHLEWGFDKRDRDFLRAAILVTAICLLLCYLHNRKKCHYSEPLSQEGGIYFDDGYEGWMGGEDDEYRRALISSIESGVRPSDLTVASQRKAVLDSIGSADNWETDAVWLDRGRPPKAVVVRSF